MNRACPCLLLKHPAPSRRIFLTFSEAQESPAQPHGREPFAPDHRAMAKGLAQLSQSGDANIRFSGACYLGSLGILQHCPSLGQVLALHRQVSQSQAGMTAWPYGEKAGQIFFQIFFQALNCKDVEEVGAEGVCRGLP